MIETVLLTPEEAAARLRHCKTAQSPRVITLTDEEWREYLPSWANRLYRQAKRNAACQISGIHFDFSKAARGKRRPFYPSLDRKDPPFGCGDGGQKLQATKRRRE